MAGRIAGGRFACDLGLAQLRPHDGIVRIVRVRLLHPPVRSRIGQQPLEHVRRIAGQAGDEQQRRVQVHVEGQAQRQHVHVERRRFGERAEDLEEAFDGLTAMKCKHEMSETTNGLMLRG